MSPAVPLHSSTPPFRKPGRQLLVLTAILLSKKCKKNQFQVTVKYGTVHGYGAFANDASDRVKFIGPNFFLAQGLQILRTGPVFFMDSIIDNAKDVTLLKSKGIIQNAIGSDKAVAELFNSLSKDITIDSKLDIVHKNVNKYCNKHWNQWRANLIHTYFRNPWALLSLVAAIFLFALTITQTVYVISPPQ